MGCWDQCFSKVSSWVWVSGGQGSGWGFRSRANGAWFGLPEFLSYGFWECHTLASPLSFKGEICLPLDTFPRFITSSNLFLPWPNFPDFHGDHWKHDLFLEEDLQAGLPDSPPQVGHLEPPSRLCPGTSEHRLVPLLTDHTVLWFKPFISSLRLKSREVTSLTVALVSREGWDPHPGWSDVLAKYLPLPSRRWCEVRPMILCFCVTEILEMPDLHCFMMWKEKQVTLWIWYLKMMWFFFYFHADAKRLAIVLIGYLSLRPSSFQDRVHILGGCFHTGFYLTALVCCPMVLTNIYHSWKRRKEEGKQKEDKCMVWRNGKIFRLQVLLYLANFIQTQNPVDLKF